MMNIYFVYICCTRWAYQPSDNIWTIPSKEGDASTSSSVHSRPVSGCHLRGRAGEGLPEFILRELRRRGEPCGTWLQRRHRLGC